jgi:hypothetical protein
MISTTFEILCLLETAHRAWLSPKGGSWPASD